MPAWDTETYEAEISHRLKDPARHSTCRRNKLGTTGVTQIYCKIKGTDTWEVQSLRFDKEKFSLAEAKKWEKDHPDAKGSANSTNALEEVMGVDFYKAANIVEPSLETNDNQAYGVAQVSIEGKNGADMGDHVAFPCSFASEGVLVSPDGRKGYRSPEEVMKMVGFCNGMRVVINHPPASPVEAHVVADLRDNTHPTIGVTTGAELAQDPTGLLKVRGQVNIWKKDRKGNDLTPLIARMEKGELNEVSIGYFYNSVVEDGAFKGQAYDHLETDVNPYHLAVLDGYEPQCAGPVCGIGVTSQSPVDKNGGSDMVDKTTTPPQGGQGEPQTPTPAPAQAPAPAPAPAPGQAADTISVKSMNLCALAEQNEQVAELVKQKNELEEAKKEGDEAKVELEAIKEEERKKKLEAIKEHLGDEKFVEVFGEKPEEKSEDFIEGFFKTVPTEETETEAEEGATGKPGRVHKDLKVPRGVNKKQRIPHNEGLTVGDHCKMGGPIRLERKE